MTETQKNETTPGQWMERFQGSSLKTIIAFTVVVHAVLLLGTSIPFLMESVLGANTSKMSEEEKIESAVSEAKASLSKIAKEHGLNVEEISSQFSAGTSASSKPASKTPTTSADAAEVKPDEPKTGIEKELDLKKDGPALPEIKDDGEEDLFK